MDRLRIVAGVLVAVSVLCQPVRLGSLRWWRTPAVAAALGLTVGQTQAIDRLYEARLAERRRCVERFVQASNRVDQLLRDGLYDDDTLRQTQEVVHAAADEGSVDRALQRQIAAILTPAQLQRVEQLWRARIIE